MAKSFWCSHIGCSVVGIAMVMRVHSDEDIRAFTGDLWITLNDLSDHALCAKHAREARVAGKKVYKLTESIDRMVERSERREARRMGQVETPRGLGSLAKRDAAKRPSPEFDSASTRALIARKIRLSY